MLIYRQRKLGTSRTGPVEIPDYWRAEVERLNHEDEAHRQNYWKLRNQFDIYLEDVNTFFTISKDNIVTYNADNTQQGNKLRLDFTDTIENIKRKIKAHIKAPQSSKFNLIEVVKLDSALCQLLNPLSSMENNV